MVGASGEVRYWVVERVNGEVRAWVRVEGEDKGWVVTGVSECW